ncbi:hypothetical protein B5X24_HaOG204732 [Helicoverpa armigera]|uniref:Uncharacterized protein n=1 Tax=Helicoverpa armigera TaxID=29058 RepID=A0A2W1BRX2_HELAM|nr:hypothetical protein B5X24_HaOG204732 [Helicoverpa armigera]
MSEISCHKQLVFRNLLMAALRSGKCSGLLGVLLPALPPPAEGVPRYALRHAAGIWRCALHLGLLRNLSIHMLYRIAWEA